MKLTKNQRRTRIKNRIRKIVSGTEAQPRLSVFRSNKEIYAQLIDDVSGSTIVSSSSTEKEISNTKGNKTETASLVGKKINENLVLTGSFTTLGDEIQITTMLIDLQSGEVPPIVKERYKIDDLLTLLEDISLKVFEKLETL